MPDAAAPAPGQPPVGRAVHALVIAAGIAGPAWYGWSLGQGRVSAAALAAGAGLIAGVLWLTVYSPADPETRRFGRVPVDGRLLLTLEVTLIVAAGAAIWAAWSRAAGETFLTVAFIDFVVRYPRLASLWRGTPTPTPLPPRRRREDRAR